jgi:hypothetical protein
MANIHPVFHASQLRRCLRVPERERVPEEEIALQIDLRYQEVPVKILDTVIKGQETVKYGFAEFSGADMEWKKLHGNVKMP